MLLWDGGFIKVEISRKGKKFCHNVSVQGGRRGGEGGREGGGGHCTLSASARVLLRHSSWMRES